MTFERTVYLQNEATTKLALLPRLESPQNN